MKKIKTATPIVELDGDEMTRHIWALIKEKLILPFLDVTLEYYDLGIQERDRTDDEVTIKAAHAIARHGVGVKCATITANAERVKEFSLKKAWPSPNATLRAILDGTVFRKPIVVKNLPCAVRSWRKPIVIARHAYGDLYKAVDYRVEGAGIATLSFAPADGSKAEAFMVHDFKGPGVLMAMHNTDASIISFARACFEYAIDQKMDMWFAAKDTISRNYHGTFRELFEREAERYQSAMEAAGVCWQYMLIDDAAARIMKHPGGLLWACMNFDGDVFSDMVASSFGSLGMMTSVLVSPSGCFEYEAAHGTVRRHYYQHLKGEPTSTNSIASIFAWTGALRKRGQIDHTPQVVDFAALVEASVIELVEEGIVTKDLAVLIAAQDKARWETTEGFIEHVATKIRQGVEKWTTL